MVRFTSRPANRTTQPLGSLLAAAGALLLGGCAAHHPVASSSTAAAQPSAQVAVRPPAPASLAERHELGGGDARKAQALLESLETVHASGQAALLAGDEAAAFDKFDDAVEMVLRSEIDLDAFPQVRDRADAIIASIHEAAAETAAEPEIEDQAAPEVPTIDEEMDAVAVTRLWDTGDMTIPMVEHPAVDSMVRFYTGRAKERLELGLSRYGKYAPTVARIFEEEGVPGELAWLALVESNYNPQAYSRARARGLWQFISSTGKRYDLDQDFWVDERSDFEKATRSAARYLRDLHGMFGDWHLALASYNAGEGKIGRAIKATGRKDFWRIRETRYIRRETKDYVPAMLAVLRIVQDPAAHGIDWRPAAPLSWETTTIRSCTDLGVIAQCAGTSLESIQDLNPELRRGTTPGGDEPYSLRIPKGTRQQFEDKYSSLPPEQRLTWHRHVVRKGDTVSAIAQRYGTTSGAILAANKLSSSRGLTQGATLLIPAGPNVETVPDAVLASRAPSGSLDPVDTGSRRITYRVRAGDTLSKIASRHGVSMQKLASWNGLRNTNRIHVGQRLTIHGGSSSSQTASRSTGSATRHHVVRSGDTLSAISRRHGVSVSALRSLNGISAGGVIRPGQRLKLSGSSGSSSSSNTARAVSGHRTHTVRPGDTLSKIAKRYSCSVSDFCSRNGIRISAAIHPGDRIAIPD